MNVLIPSLGYHRYWFLVLIVVLLLGVVTVSAAESASTTIVEGPSDSAAIHADWSDASKATVDDDGSPEDRNVCCASSGADGNLVDFGDYNFSLNSDSTIEKVEVGLDHVAGGSILDGVDTQTVEISTDGGSSWGPVHRAEPPTSLDGNVNVWFDVTGDATWDVEKLSNANFKVRVGHEAHGRAENTYLDYVPVRVTTGRSLKITRVCDDGDGCTEEWVEVYNPSNQTLTLDGLEESANGCRWGSGCGSSGSVSVKPDEYFLFGDGITSYNGATVDQDATMSPGSDEAFIIYQSGVPADTVGWDATGSDDGQPFEGTPIDISSSIDASRDTDASGEPIDTQDNAADFTENNADMTPKTGYSTGEPATGDDGTFTLSPGNNVSVNGLQTWTLAYDVGSDTWKDGRLQFDLPDSWGDPQLTDGNASNFVTTSVSGGSLSDSRIINGDTIELDVASFDGNGQVEVTYGDDTRSDRGYARAPGTTGSYTFRALADTDGTNPEPLAEPNQILDVVNPGKVSLDPAQNPESFIGTKYDLTATITAGGKDLYGVPVSARIRGGDGTDSAIEQSEGQDYLPGSSNKTDTGLTQGNGEVVFDFQTATRIETDVVDVTDTNGLVSAVHRDSLRNPFPVISEVGWDSTEEYFELYNPTLRTQDLTDWWVSDEAGNTEIDTSTFDSLGSIGPHRYLVIERSEDAVEGQSDIVDSNISFTDSGETLVLRNSSNVQVDEHGGGGDWFAGVDNEHIAMERRFVVQTGGIARSWADADSEAQYGDAPNPGKGSPGFPNATSLENSTISTSALHTNNDTVGVILQILVNPSDTQPDVPTQFVTDNSLHSVQTQPGVTSEDGYGTGVLQSGTNEGTSVVNIALPVISDSTAISDTVVFDYTDPDSANIARLVPTDGLDTNLRDVDFDWGTVSDTLSGLSHYRLQVSRDSTFSDLVHDDTYVESRADPAVTNNLADTTYWWRVRATDNAGNSTTFSSSDTFTVDGTPPESFTLLSPEEDAETNVLTVPFEWNASSDTLSGLNHYTITVDTGTGFNAPLVFEGDTISTDTDVTFNEDGNVIWRVTARDKAGNTVTSSDSTFLIDRTEPVVDSGPLSVSDGTDTAFLEGLDGDSVLSSTGNHKYTASVSGANQVSVYYSLDGSLATASDSSFLLSNTTGDTWKGSLGADSFTAGDSVNFILEAKDTATNTVVSDSAGSRYRYRISDNVLPTVDLTFPDTGAYVGGIDVSGTYVLMDPDNDPGTVTVEVSDDSGTSWDTEATISGEVGSVTSSGSGETHAVRWDSLTDLGTVEDTTIKLRIKAFDGTDTGGWDTSAAFTVDNIIPRSETIGSTADIAPPDTGVSLQWTPGTSDVAYYRIYRTGGTSDTSAAVEIDTTSIRHDTTIHLDPDVTQGDSYFYYVTTVDTAGNESDSSNATSAPYLSIWKTTDHDSTQRPGDTVIYTISFLNEGFAPAGEVAVYDAIPDSMTLTDTAVVVDTPVGITEIDIEYERNGTWGSSSIPREPVDGVRWIVPGSAAGEQSIEARNPDTTNHSGRVRFFTEVD